MTLVDVLRARKRIAPYVRRTPLVRSAWLSDLAGATVSLKLESLQRSNSFKSRGAFNAVIARLERHGRAPAQLVTASAGNHGRALAAAAEAFRLPLIVFTPADAAKTVMEPNCAPTAAITTTRSGWRKRLRRTPAPSSSRPTTIRTSSPAQRPWRSRSSRMRRIRTRSSCPSAAAG
jgi:threonine dehydratase